MEAEKKAGDQYGDEMHKLRMLLSRSEATAIVKVPVRLIVADEIRV